MTHRYEQLIEALKLKSVRALETSIKINVTTIAQAIRRDSKVTADIALKICKKYPQVNFDWLMTGEGNIFNTVEDSPIESKSENVERSFTQIAKEFIFGPNLKPMEDADKEILNDLKAIQERLDKRLEERRMNNKKNNS